MFSSLVDKGLDAGNLVQCMSLVGTSSLSLFKNPNHILLGIRHSDGGMVMVKPSLC